MEGAMLRRSRPVALDGQVGEESADVLCSYLRRMTRGVKQHTSRDLADVGVFRASTPLLETYDVPPVVESSCLWLHGAPVDQKALFALHESRREPRKFFNIEHMSTPILHHVSQGNSEVCSAIPYQKKPDYGGT